MVKFLLVVSFIVAGLAAANASNDDDGCLHLQETATKDGAMPSFVLTTDTKCFVTPGDETEQFRLTFDHVVPENARFAYHDKDHGAAWDSDFIDSFNDVVYGAKTFTIDHPAEACISVIAATEATITIQDNPMNTADMKDSASDKDAIMWTGDKFVLKADSFSYNILGDRGGEVVWDPSLYTSIEVDGDPGDDKYISIEIIWYPTDKIAHGEQRRMFMYFTGDEEAWSVDEIRLYNDQASWEEFHGSKLLSASKGSCFHDKHWQVSNAKGSTISFDGLAIAAFLPWANEADVKKCIMGCHGSNGRDHDHHDHHDHAEHHDHEDHMASSSNDEDTDMHMSCLLTFITVFLSGSAFAVFVMHMLASRRNNNTAYAAVDSTGENAGMEVITIKKLQDDDDSSDTTEEGSLE